MAEMDPLSALKDIHLPEPISWWPLSFGWYLVILLVLIACYGLFTVSYYLYKNGAPKRAALRLLKQYEKNHQDTKETCTNLSELLKRVALVYFPQEHVAGLSDDEWISFLNLSGKGLNFEALKEMLLIYPYQANPPPTNLMPLFSIVRTWIKQRSRRCLH